MYHPYPLLALFDMTSSFVYFSYMSEFKCYCTYNDIPEACIVCLVLLRLATQAYYILLVYERCKLCMRVAYHRDLTITKQNLALIPKMLTPSFTKILAVSIKLSPIVYQKKSIYSLYLALLVSAPLYHF